MDQFQEAFENATQESTDTTGSAADTQSEVTQTEQAQAIADLESMERFKFQGKEWTPKDLQNSMLMESDYRKKTQVLADERRAFTEERKFESNLRADLLAVKQNPQLMGEFMRIYPKKYHEYLEDYIQHSPTQQSSGQQQQSAQQQMQSIAQQDPKFYRDFLQMQQGMQEREVQAIESKLDAQFSTLSKKYSLADEDVVLAKGQMLLDKKGTLSDQDWERLWKDTHDKEESKFKTHYSKQVNAQKAVNKRGQDVPGGGAIPGQKPRTPKNIKEASEFVLAELENS